MTNYTTPDQSIEFKKLDLPESDLKYFQHQCGRFEALLMNQRPMLDGNMYVELGPAYSLDQILKILSHYYKPQITSLGTHYRVDVNHVRDDGMSCGQGKSIAEAAGYLLIQLINHDKFFTAPVCKDVIKRYISTHE